ncbi:MAG: CAP domain-containing protein [Armatimonadota bacterium]
MTRSLFIALLALFLFCPVLAESAAVALTPRWTEGQFAGEEAVERAVAWHTNIERRKRGLQPVALDHRLRVAARQHSLEMGTRRYFNHYSPVAAWRTPWQRAYYAGFWGPSVGENILLARKCRYRKPEQIGAYFVRLWMNSPTHRKNLLNPEWTRIGVGVARVGGAWYASQEFGLPIVSLGDVTLAPETGEMMCLRLEGMLQQEPLELWVDRELISTVTPAGRFSTTLNYPRHSGKYLIEAVTGGQTAWIIALDTDSEENWLSVRILQNGIIANATVDVQPYAGLRLTGSAQVPPGQPIYLLRDGNLLCRLDPDRYRRVSFSQVLPRRKEPYTVSFVSGHKQEDLLFIDTNKPLPQAFLGRPQ